MEEPSITRRASSRRRLALASAGLAVIAATFAIGAIAKLGPFGEDSLSSTQFLLAGDEICKRAHDAYAALQKRPPASAPAAAELTQRLIDISRGELEAIRALNATAGEQAALDRYLAARQRAIAILERAHRAAESKDATAYLRTQADLAAGQAARRRLARAVGFRECSLPPGTAR